MCEELGEIPSNLPFYIENNIDWDGVASDLATDYVTVLYERDEYYMRMS
jgi:hypothetical protein